ncbi:MAG: hypothetical protein H6648_04540 [Caldilineae bacterium]|nr:hypothetical protein [Chloroflexota bacterium]MCB9176407.1 hypothetical protein [Caldilineae bacterium]
MTALVTVIERYSAWLYVLLGVLMTRQIHHMWRAAREHDTALFGLEREAATGKAVRALVSLLLYGTIGLGVYTVTTAIAPGLPKLGEPGGPAPPILQPPPTAAIETDTPTAPPYTVTPPPARIITSTPRP